MFLSEKEIKKLVDKGEIQIQPFDEAFQLFSAYVDIKISNRYYRYPKEIELELEMLDLKNPYINIVEQDYISEKGVVIEPQRFLIFESLEYLKVPDNVMVYVQPKFRLAKMGLVLTNSGFLEPGFEGNINLCIYNTNNMPVRVFPDMTLCHILFAKVF